MNRASVFVVLLSAALFGASTPLAKLLLGAIDPWMLAGLLDLGAGLGLAAARAGGGVGRRLLHLPPRQAPLRCSDIPLLGLVVVAGGVLGPVLLMAGLARSDAATASLLLNLEGLATMGLAWVAFGENARALASSRGAAAPPPSRARPAPSSPPPGRRGRRSRRGWGQGGNLNRPRPCSGILWRRSLMLYVWAGTWSWPMRRSVLLSGCALVAVAATAAPKLLFWNETATTMTGVYLAPAGTGAFGPNQTSNDDNHSVEGDERLPIIGVEPGRYDVKLVDRSGRTCMVRDVEVRGTGKVAFGIDETQLTDCK